MSPERRIKHNQRIGVYGWITMALQGYQLDFRLHVLPLLLLDFHTINCICIAASFSYRLAQSFKYMS